MEGKKRKWQERKDCAPSILLVSFSLKKFSYLHIHIAGLHAANGKHVWTALEIIFYIERYF